MLSCLELLRWQLVARLKEEEQIKPGWELVQSLYWECMKFLSIIHNSDPSRISAKYLGRP